MALAFSLERAKKRAIANPTRVTDAAEIARAPAAHLRRPASDIRERGHFREENHGPSTGTRAGGAAYYVFTRVSDTVVLPFGCRG